MSSSIRRPAPDDTTQSASFEVGGLRLELSAAPGAARLIVSGDGGRDVYVVDPAVLAAWSGAVDKLLTLGPAPTAAERVELRTPFLIDREGRPSIALEGLVTEQGVSHRLLVSGAEGRIAGLMTTIEIVRGIAEAAGGAILVARRSG